MATENTAISTDQNPATTTQIVDEPPKQPTKKDAFALKFGSGGFHTRYMRARLNDIDKAKPETLESFLCEFAATDDKRVEMTEAIKSFTS